MTRPENTVRWRWQVGDVAFWDNRATQHYAIADYGDQSRRVQRVTIAGDLPVSIDGKRTEVLTIFITGIMDVLNVHSKLTSSRR